MIKKYISKSDISLSVQIKDGKSAHISFDPLTGGGSVLYTDDEELQEALKKHHQYGRLFREDANTLRQRTSLETPTPELKVKNQEAEQTSKTVHIDSLYDAVEYLCEHYDYSRTKLRSKKSAQEAAAAHGFVFEGLE